MTDFQFWAYPPLKFSKGTKRIRQSIILFFSSSVLWLILNTQFWQFNFLFTFRIVSKVKKFTWTFWGWLFISKPVPVQTFKHWKESKTYWNRPARVPINKKCIKIKWYSDLMTSSSFEFHVSFIEQLLLMFIFVFFCIKVKQETDITC